MRCRGAACIRLRLCPTFPLLTFSEQLRMYMGIAMTTSSQACTVPALHWDMGVVLASSTCWRRSSWSSEPSDRLRRVGLQRLSESEWRVMIVGGKCAVDAGVSEGRAIKKKAKRELQCETNGELNINLIRGEWVLMASRVDILNICLHDSKATFWQWCCSHSYHFENNLFSHRASINWVDVTVGEFPWLICPNEPSACKQQTLWMMSTSCYFDTLR